MGDNQKDTGRKTTVNAIYDMWKKRGDSETPRAYLGGSIIGHKCERYLWYNFRHCCREDIPGRVYRLFDLGNVEEIRIVNDLKSIGVTVHEHSPDTGQQFGVSAVGGHLKGHLDGCGKGFPEDENTWHVLEFKTHNTKSFKDLSENGVRTSKPVHYSQMQVYMGLTGMRRAYYIAVCKDSQEMYGEILEFDEDHFKSLMQKAERVIRAKQPPERISDRADYWECKFCSARSICWGPKETEPVLPVPFKSCRQCCFSTPVVEEGGDGKWRCEKFGADLKLEDQLVACRHHLVLPWLVEHAGKPVDSSDDCITFENADGTVWKNGCGSGAFDVDELVETPSGGFNKIVTMKDILGVKVTGSEEVPF